MAALDLAARRIAEPFVTHADNDTDQVELSIPAVHCASCIQRIESNLLTSPGIVSARVNLTTRHATVRWRKGQQTADAVIEQLARLGFDAMPFDSRVHSEADRIASRMLLRCLGVAAFAAGNVMLLSVAVWAGLAGSMGSATRTAFYIVSGIIAVPATLYAGRPFYASAWRALRHGRANMDVPISLAVLLALVLSIYQTAIGAPYAYFDASVSLLFFLLIGRSMDQSLRARTRSAGEDLLSLQSTSAQRIAADGSASLVPVLDLNVGDRVLVAPGERVPVDAVVEAGSSQIDVSLVTGETDLHSAQLGQRLGAGTLNMTGLLTLKVAARVENSLVAELTRIMEAAEQRRSRMTLLADRAAKLYVPVVHTAAAGVFIYWCFFTAGGFMDAMHNAIATLIITCPCGLGLAVPATQVVAVGRLLRLGVIAKSGAALERLSQVDIAVIDKTGTLTLGRPSLVNADTIDADALKRAASLARASRHPLSKALANTAGPGPVAEGVKEIPGCGIEASMDGKTARLGSRAWVTGAADDAHDLDYLSLWFTNGQGTPVQFRFADALREDARALIEGLAKRNIPVVLLSGDRVAAVKKLAEQIGITEWHGEVGPVAKTAFIQQLSEKGRKALMVGDGLNDAASLSLAHASMAPASAIDSAQTAADFIVTTSGLAPVLSAIDVARSARSRIFQGFAFAAVYNVFALPFGAAGLVTPVISAISMSASSIVVMLNALRPMGGHAR